MAESRGSLKLSNGSHVNGKMNGQAVGRKRTTKKRRSIMGWAFSAIARIVAWAAIITILFRCPSALETCDEASPFICEHYFRAKAAVLPYAEPYYQQYITPYVDLAKPYYEVVDSHVLAPTRVYVVQYGSPWLRKGQEHAWSQWEKYGQPQVAHLRALSQQQYDQFIEPYLTRATKAVEPYYEIGRTNSLQLFYEFLLPTYEFVQPYAVQGYSAASSFATGTALPVAHWTLNKTNAFLDRAVWPQMRVVYVENVEPQLLRIGERLGRYKNQAKNKVLSEGTSASVRSSTSEPPRSSFSKPAPQSTASSISTALEQPSSVVSSEPPAKSTEVYLNPVQAPSSAENESEQRKKAREMVAQDLELWQNKFAEQADEGAASTEDRIDEIARRMINDEAVAKGRPLIKNLESVIQSETDSLKLKMHAIITDFGSSTDDAEQQVISTIRSVGIDIKKAAQAIRSWREGYDVDLQETVLRTADVHFQILDETRGLALQQIGMKWAWTDGVTYKDWAKYHELKKTLNKWTEELKQIIVTHPTLLEAQHASAQIEDEGMAIASTAAKELARLKQVAIWKISAKDVTANFDSDAMKLAAKAKHQHAEAARTNMAENSDEDDTVVEKRAEPAFSATKAINREDLEATPSFADKKAAGIDVPSISASAMKAAASVADVADGSSKVEPEGQSLGPEARNGMSDVGEKLPVAVEDASSPLAKSEVPMAAVEVRDDEISENTATEPAHVPEDDAEATDGDEDMPRHRSYRRTTDTASVKPAFFGAAAQAVSGRQPVLDEEEDADDMLSSVTSGAEAAYSSAVALASDQYSSAVSIVSAQIYGSPEPVHDQLLSSLSAAYDNARSAANSKMNEVIHAASSGVYGVSTVAPATPTLVDWTRVESIAAERLNEGKLWAELRYQSALIAMGLTTPTPTSPSEKYYEQAKYNYYAGLGLAQDRYNSFMAAASSAWSTVTGTPTPTSALTDSASSMASEANKSIASAVHAAGEAAESVYSAATKKVISAADAVDGSFSAVSDAAAEQIYSAGVAIGGTWETVISGLSAQVYGQPTPIGWYESLFIAASASASTATEAAAEAVQTGSADAVREYEAVSELVSELIMGREPRFTESVLSRLGAAYATAVEKVGSLASEASAAAGDKVGSVMGKATEAAKEATQQARDEL